MVSFFSLSEDTTKVFPAANAIKISTKDASNEMDANCKTRLSGLILNISLKCLNATGAYERIVKSLNRWAGVVLVPSLLNTRTKTNDDNLHKLVESQGLMDGTNFL